MTTRRGPWPWHAVAAVCGIVAVGAAVAAMRVGLHAAGPAGARAGLVVDVAVAAVAGLVARGVLRRPRDRRSRIAWITLAAFPFVWLLAPVAWLVGAPEVVGEIARASAVLLVGGSWWFASRVGGLLSQIRPAVDGGIGAAAALILGWEGPLTAAWTASGGGLPGAVAVALPVAMAGAAVLGATITVTEMPPARWPRPALFVLAMMTMVASDVVWAVQGPPFWAAGWAVYALAMRMHLGLTPRVVRVPTRGRLVYLPYALIAPSVVVLVVQARGGGVSGPQVGAGLAIVALLVLRQHVTLLENDRLVARLEETERLLRHRATHDSLTGLPGRAALHEHLSALASPRTPDARPLAVAFVDVDDFKGTNDRYGHGSGDAVLVEVARRLVAALPHDDPQAFASRLGGDEFAVVVTGPAVEDPAGLADRLTRALSGTVRVGPVAVDVRVSAGAATVTRGELVPSALLHDADLAMYAVKRDHARQAALDGPADPAAG